MLCFKPRCSEQRHEPRPVCRLAATLVAAGGTNAQQPVLNLYSARHYQTDEALYANFTSATGIKINRIDADDAGILARLKTEGASSPADVILLVDAARLWRAEIDGSSSRSRASCSMPASR